MRLATRIATYGLLVAFCCANTPAPFGAEARILNHISALARGNAPVSKTALHLLEHLALGASAAIDPDAEIAVGLKSGDLRSPGFRAIPVRQEAIWQIGETGLPEAITFLSNLKISDFPDDKTLGLWSRAQTAIRNAEYVGIEDPREKIRFLQSVLTENSYAASHGGGVGSWAIDELCDRGASSALPEIRESLRRSGNSQRYADDLEFCQERIQAISSHPDRVKALGGVLRTDDPPQSDRLISWAINELTAMHTQEADAELRRFVEDVDKLPQGSPEWQRLWTARAQIVPGPPPLPKR